MTTNASAPEPIAWLAIASYQLDGPHKQGVPEAQLTAYLEREGLAPDLLGAGVSLNTGERDVELRFTATPSQRDEVEQWCDTTFPDVWEVMEYGDDD